MAANKYTCTMCGKAQNESNFYLSKSGIYKATGKLPICKSCMGELYDIYYKKYGNEKLALYYLCRKLDVCYNISSYNGVMNEIANGKQTEAWRIYMTKLNSLGGKNGAGNTFDDSDSAEKEIIDEASDYIENDELIIRWGKSFSKQELQYLEKTYHQWLTHHDCDKLSIQKLVQMICIKELEIRNTRECGKPTDKLEKSLMELMNSSNLTPKTMSAVNETDSSKIYGVWLKDIEQYKPAEYFKDKKLYYDNDGIMDYFNRFILRPMKNLLCNTREFDKEFMIEDEEDSIEENGGDD